MKSNFVHFLLYLHRHSRRKTQKGFTLIELLIVIFVGGIVISALLAQAVDFLTIDLKETALAATQRDMKSALDFVAQDVREAVYIYNGTELANLESYLPDFGTDRKLVLAFWKVERLPYIEDSDPKYNLPSDCSTAALTEQLGDSGNLDDERQECRETQIERSAYTLIAYVQNTTGASDSWQGASRLERFELRKYKPDELNKLTHTTGYIDPRKESSFEDWPKDPVTLASLQSTRPTDDTDILVDFVAAPNSTSITANSCPTDYTRTPTDTNYKSFYGCVRDLDADNAFNQDVILYLTGNASGKPGISSDSAYLPQLETQVIGRGVIDRNATN